MQGTIKSFGPRGFGFISRQGEPDLYFHCEDSPQALQSDFRPGRSVTFSIRETLSKTRAVGVRVEPSAVTEEGTPEKQIGWVKTLHSEKGYGFIETESGDNVFFHRSGVLENGFGYLELDTPLEFSVEFGERGRTAVNVRPF
jgi:CspA family cold shock protein